MWRQLVLLLLGGVGGEGLRKLLDCLAEIDGDFWLVSKRVLKDLDEDRCLLWRARHHVRMVHANLEDDPANCFTHLNRRVLEHIKQLRETWAKDLGKVLLVRAIGSGSESHECRVAFLPLFVHDVGLDELHDTG